MFPKQSLESKNEITVLICWKNENWMAGRRDGREGLTVHLLLFVAWIMSTYCLFRTLIIKSKLLFWKADTFLSCSPSVWSLKNSGLVRASGTSFLCSHPPFPGFLSFTPGLYYLAQMGISIHPTCCSQIWLLEKLILSPVCPHQAPLLNKIKFSDAAWLLSLSSG